MNCVVAVDPGYDRVGIAVFRGGSLLYSECFSPASKVFAERLVEIRGRLQEVVREYRAGALALETLFFSKNQKTALKVAEARGVIECAAAELKLQIFEYSPQAVKIAVTGSGNADKKSVMKMVERLVELPPKTVRYDDELDAIALGIAHLAVFRLSPGLSTAP